MAGTKFLFISIDLGIVKIPTPKNGIYKARPKLANQLVLEVIMHYETEARKPSKLSFVFFNRLQLDSKGQYVFTQQEFNDRSRNFVLFAFQTPETLSEKDKPIPIPRALDIPTPSEKEILIKYIKECIPELYPEGVYIIESTIQSRIETNKNNINLVKQASKLKNKKRNN